MLCLFFSVLRGEFDIHALFLIRNKASLQRLIQLLVECGEKDGGWRVGRG